MKTVLIVPESLARQAAGIPERSRLTWSEWHPGSYNGIGVLTYDNGNSLYGSDFRLLRDKLGARIVTSDPKRVRRALCLSEREPGIDKA